MPGRRSVTSTISPISGSGRSPIVEHFCPVALSDGCSIFLIVDNGILITANADPEETIIIGILSPFEGYIHTEGISGLKFYSLIERKGECCLGQLLLCIGTEASTVSK